ncbi:squalene epoxidase-domain-containing protein [Phlyctochytrium arcticum]|nr:squalene epoxidase-domain-containing protein [Phlyctochytrium arcticum]
MCQVPRSVVKAAEAAEAAEPATTHPVTLTGQNVKTEYDAIIIGAGILGASLAATLGRQGRDVLVLERDWSEPDRIVGELLQPGGVKALKELGLEDCLEGIDAIPCHGYAVFYPPEEVILPYPSDRRPNEGRSFHHGRFVQKLRGAARSSPNVTCVEGTASTLISCEIAEQVMGVVYTTKDKEGSSHSHKAFAPLTVVADGCFSKFRKQHISKEVKGVSNFVGLILEKCPLPHPNHGHVILADPSPILLYQIGTNETRILVDIPGKLPSIGSGALQQYLEDKVMPQLPKSIQPSFKSALQSQRIRSMPNSFLPPSTNTRSGVVYLGDAMNMRHPLTGGGMTVAFWDVVHVRNLLNMRDVPDLADTEMVMSQMTWMHWKRKSLSGVVNILAQALYSLFSAGDDPHMRTLQLSCFGYFKLGGRCVSTPVGLLGGILPEPMTLIGHFFAVAFYGVYLILTGKLEPAPSSPTGVSPPSPSVGQLILDFPRNFWRSLLAIYTACIVIFPVIASELQA